MERSDAPLIVAIGGGEREEIPLVARQAVDTHVGTVWHSGLPPDLLEPLAPNARPLTDGAVPVGGDLVLATDRQALTLADASGEARTVPDRAALRARTIGAEVAALVAVGAELRRECPWDRRQTPDSIVPHTVEEAFEVAEAVASGDPDHLTDELGDLLFQSIFLAQFLEEDGHVDLGGIADGQREKLISRHPHVYGDQRAAEAADVVSIWERRKRAERRDEGIFHGLPPGLPALSLATKVHKRAAAIGFEWPDADAALEKLSEEVDELRDDPGARELGDVLLAALAVARAVGADAELALRAAADRFRDRIELAVARAADEGEDFESLPVDDQIRWYRAARAELEGEL